MDLKQVVTQGATGMIVSVLDSPSQCYGNVAMSNRFRALFLKSQYTLRDSNGNVEYDPIGGNGSRFIGVNQVLGEDQALIGAISIAIDETVESMIATETDNMPDEEKISSATLSDLYIEQGVVVAEIELVPKKVESVEDLQLRVPIVKRSI